ncbi:UNVERIFIED_CONTAM: hypothetical protein K2H54_003803 [Gekko kuhli]
MWTPPFKSSRMCQLWDLFCFKEAPLEWNCQVMCASGQASGNQITSSKKERSSKCPTGSQASEERAAASAAAPRALRLRRRVCSRAPAGEPGEGCAGGVGGVGGPGGREAGRGMAAAGAGGGCSLHGLRQVLGGGRGGWRGRRGLWAAALAGALGLLALAGAARLAFFWGSPAVSRVDEVAAAALPFPAVTLCNRNGLRLSRLTRNDLFHAGRLLALLDGRRHLRGPPAAAALRHKADFRGFRARPFDMADLHERAGHDLDHMLWRCAFRGAPCSARNFSVVSQLGPEGGREGHVSVAPVAPRVARLGNSAVQGRPRLQPGSLLAGGRAGVAASEPASL